MTAVLVLAALALALLAPLLVTAVRQRTLLTMAGRNIRRRRAEAVLVVGGALFGTAIITSSFVVGDVVEASFRDTARTAYGPIDITVTSTADVPLADVSAAVAAARVEGVEGVLPATVGTVTLEAPDRDAAVPRLRVVELDLDAARRLGSDPSITGLGELDVLPRGGVVLNARTADELGASAGETLRLHAEGGATDLVVSDVVDEVGVAGYGGAIIAPGTLAATTPAPSAGRGELLVSLDGGVFDTRERSDQAVADLRAAVSALAGVEVAAPKAAVLDDAAREGAGFTELFSIIGSFSVLAGILLLVNLFVTLAEERKTELGMLRAVGFTRRRLTRAFAIEGAVYALAAAAVGAVAGVGIGWLVAVVAGAALGDAVPGSTYPLVVEPISLATGGLLGLSISLATIWATSTRIARLNVIRAIRDLPEPPRTDRRRGLVLATLGVLTGLAVGVAGHVAGDPIALLLGVPVASFAAVPLLRRVVAERTARLLGATTVLVWGLGAWAAFPSTMNVDGNPALFVLQGVVLTAGAVSAATSLDRVLAAVIARLGRRGGGLAPRLGLAYPLARRFRTSMLLSMFSLVIFTVTILASVSATFARSTDITAAEVAAGFDVVLDTDPARPVDLATLTARDDVTAAAGLVRGVAEFEAAHLDGTRAWTITGFDGDLLARGTPSLVRHDDAYPSDEATFAAVLADPTRAIVPDGFLAGVGGSELTVGDTFAVVDPVDGRSHTLTVAGLASRDFVGNGALVAREVAASALGADGTTSRVLLATSDGADPAEVAGALVREHLADGAEAEAISAVVADAVREQAGLLGLLQGFLGLGLLVGTAGLGVVMVRAVRERRRDIGTLRALGVGTGVVRGAFLSEAGLITVQGTLIGSVLGLLTTRHLLSELGDQLPFTVPWFGLIIVVAVPLLASLLATAWPASRAAAVRPAVALRAAD